MSEPAEQQWLDQAVELAAKNVTSGGGPFGALVVKDGELIATGVNQVTPTLDPTAHAEVVAIRAACQKLQSFKLDGCLLVASCEPCPLCLSSALWARMDRVIFAADRNDAASAGFDDQAFYEVFTSPQSTWPLTVEHIGGSGPHCRSIDGTPRPTRSSTSGGWFRCGKGFRRN